MNSTNKETPTDGAPILGGVKLNDSLFDTPIFRRFLNGTIQEVNDVAKNPYKRSAFCVLQERGLFEKDKRDEVITLYKLALMKQLPKDKFPTMLRKAILYIGDYTLNKTVNELRKIETLKQKANETVPRPAQESPC